VKTKKLKPAKKPAAKKATPATVLILRTCDENMQSHGGFTWPKSGPVEAKDWQPTNECGNGLHGFLWGEGNGSLCNWDTKANWLVAEVDAATVIDLAGKVKFPRANVVFCGDRKAATEYIRDHGAQDKLIVGGTATAGDRGTATAGYSGTATAGDSGTATAGDSGTATAGYRGTATAGYSGTATAGDSGTATAGYSGTATSGYSGTSTSGDRGTSTSGDRGIIVCRWYDRAENRYRLTVGYPGEGGIVVGKKYRADEAGKLVEVEGK